METKKTYHIEGVVWRVERAIPSGFYGCASFIDGRQVLVTAVQPSVLLAQAELKSELCRLLKIPLHYAIESASGAFLD